MGKKERIIGLEELSKTVPWITVYGFDYSKYPIEFITEVIMKNEESEFHHTFRALVSMASTNRKDALILLYGMFEFYKNNIRMLEVIADGLDQYDKIRNPQFIEFLFDQIQTVKSCNTNRVYLNRLIKVLSSYPSDLVLDGFLKLRQNKIFSFRMKNKFDEIIYEFKPKNKDDDDYLWE
jgi:hypothetical protein